MPSPILFFIFVIVLDLILKSSKDRKKIKESRPSTPRPMEDLKKILDQELQRERQRDRQRQVSRGQAKMIRPKEDNPKVEDPREYRPDQRAPQRVSREKAPKREEAKQVHKREKELDIKRNILMGIVFSEILSEPKSVQNQRRSL